MPIAERASAVRLNELFPLVTPPPPPKTFELGLMFGGTVSAGAYTAGAIDFLLEALDAWHKQPGGPPFSVKITNAAGTSGGAVCASILGILSGHTATPIHGHQSDLEVDSSAKNNPLWDVWINGFQITNLLMTSDLDANDDVDSGTGVKPGDPPAGDGTPVQHTTALLNGRSIKANADSLISFASGASHLRSYFATPFRISVTLANLRGIPYLAQELRPYKGEASNPFAGAAYLQHDDYARFAFPNGALSAQKREDEFWIDPSGSGSGVVGYAVLAQYATASGSVPVGLVAQTLVRPAEHYWYRPALRFAPTPGQAVDTPNLSFQAKVDYPVPDWSELPEVQQSGLYQFTAVDGGCFNNEPFGLVHRDLAGLIGQNPRGSGDANRAILMIDPLVDQPAGLKHSGRSLLRVAQQLAGMFVSGARYLTADRDLFRNEDVFSRFEMVPTRRAPDRIGEAALAGSILGAVGGWCARPLRVHDFLLGRANMQEYLSNELVLSGDNPLFADWPFDTRKAFATGDDGKAVVVTAQTDRSTYFLPIIPDLTGIQNKDPDWPVGKLDADALLDPVTHRIQSILKKLRADNLPGFVYESFDFLIIPAVSHVLGKLVIGQLKKDQAAAAL